MIYGHGDDIFRYGDKIKMNFSSNVYNRADYTELKEHLMDHFEVVSHYPEPDAHSLESMIAEKLEVPENTVMVTNGANEAIYLIAQLYKGWASIILQGLWSPHLLRHYRRARDATRRPYLLALQPKQPYRQRAREKSHHSYRP